MNHNEWTKLLADWDAKRASTEAALNDVLTEISLMLRGDSRGPTAEMVGSLMDAQVHEDEARADLATIILTFVTDDLTAAARQIQVLNINTLPSHIYT